MCALERVRVSSPRLDRPRHTVRLVACVAATCALLQATSPALAQPDFRGLGLARAANYPPYISADGQTVACTCPFDLQNDIACRWTEAGGLQSLPFARSGTLDISADGSQIAGWAGGSGRLWIGSDFQQIGLSFWPYGMSAAGEVIAGAVFGPTRPVFWRIGDPFFEWLPLLPGSSYGSVMAVSAEGSVLVGWTNDGGFSRAARWTIAGEVIDLAPGNHGFARAVLADGATVFGDSGGFAFRWTAETGLVQLSRPAGYSAAWANSAAENESFVVGSGVDAGGISRALIWNRAGRCREVAEFLRGIGVSQADGWNLQAATDISADGRAFVGLGHDPSGLYMHWLARVGPLCPGDANVDGVVDLSDLATLLAHFGTAPDAARIDGDMDDDGDVELDDLALLLSQYGTTCGN
jgi:uncharacterized membrane protein